MANIRTRVAVVLTVAASVVMTTAVVPAIGHGDGEARIIDRDVSVGPYMASVWQVADDESGTATTTLFISFYDDEPDAVSVSVDAASPTLLTASPVPGANGGWQTIGTVASGDVFSVGATTESGEWWSQPITVPYRPGGTTPIRVLIVTIGLLCVGAIAWLGSRTPRVWGTRTAEPETSSLFERTLT